MRTAANLWFALSILSVACSEPRDDGDPPLVFADIDPILEVHCLECHSGDAPEAGYSVEDYLETIRCVPSGDPATLPSDPTAPILAVLQQPGHDEFLDDTETMALEDWVVEGAIPQRQGSHPPQWIDPRTDDWHGSYLRLTDWQPIVDPTRDDACGLCHAGSPAPVPGIVSFAPGATDCTVCHDLPGGVMECGTCHGDGLRPVLPRDLCYFPDSPSGGAHLSHILPSVNAPQPIDCSACHFGEDFLMLDGLHGNGEVDVNFHPNWGGQDASYDFETQVCATTCHTRGGDVPVVAWDEEIAIDCGSCHQNPPPGHPMTDCSTCHQGVNATGTRLAPDAPHLNGRVDAF